MRRALDRLYALCGGVGDLSSGLIPIPLWLPRAAMTAGVIALLVACIDSFVEAAQGRTPGHAQWEAEAVE